MAIFGGRMSDNHVNICLSCDENYSKYAGGALRYIDVVGNIIFYIKEGSCL